METQNINVNIRMDRHLKKEMDDLCQDLGMNLSTAFNIFAKAMVRQQRIPFMVSMDVPNKETKEAIAEAREIMNHPEQYKGYRDVHSMFQEILNEGK